MKWKGFIFYTLIKISGNGEKPPKQHLDWYIGTENFTEKNN